MITFFDYLKLIAEEAVAQAPNPAGANPAMGNPNMANPAMGNPAMGNPAMGNPAMGKGNMNQGGSQPYAKIGSQNAAKEKQKLEKMLGNNYKNFVVLLGKNINDPKFVNFIKAGLDDGIPQDDVVKYQIINVPCNQLFPTQNEIGVDQSLMWPLTKDPASKLMSYFQGEPQIINTPIITCCGGKYVIDGHHRWSQLYCMNPRCPINCIDMTGMQNPNLALKVAQLGAVVQGTFRITPAKGKNLLVIPEDTLKGFVAQNMGDQAYQAFSQLSQSQPSNQQQAPQQAEAMNMEDPVVQFAMNYIWKNVRQMQANNKPIAGASKRDFMPQTGDDPNAFMQQMGAGGINWNMQA